MKRLLLLNVFLFFTISINAQGWGQTQKIVPDDRFLGQFFGATVAIDGNYAVVGVLVSGSAKDAYVFENDGTGNWVQTQKLESPDPHQFAHFGTAVAIDGDFILVGSWGQHYDANAANYVQSAGAVYIFKKQASGVFEFEQKIVASDREALNAFGYAVAINGDYAIVSPVRHDYDASGNNFLDDAGTAYVFERDTNGTWTEVQKIVASDRAAFDYFGQVALAVEGNYIAVGSYAEDEDENSSNTILSAGAAYIFERDINGVWNEIQKIVASDREQGELFGWSIGLGGDTLVVGALQEYLTGNTNAQYGATYVFERDVNGDWNEVQKIRASNVEHQSKFGHTLDIDGNRIIVGAYFKDIGSPGNDGAAYVFENQSGVWTESAYIYDTFNKTSEYFGYDVAISGDYAFVGAYEDDEDENEENTLSSAGAVFIFDANEPNTLSIVETDFSNSIKAYPNPVKDILNVDLGSFSDFVDVNVYNSLGQLVLMEHYKNTKELQLPLNVNQGLYLIEIKIENQVSTLRIVKH